MSDSQLALLVGMALLVGALVAWGYKRGRGVRVADLEMSLEHYRSRSGGAGIRERDIVLRDALYLVRRHLAGLQTSRRRSHMSERAWGRAIRLCRQADLIEGWDGVAGWRWAVGDYRVALEALQRASRERTEMAQKGNYVPAIEEDW